ncbi:peptidoglycan-binding protein, partial [Eubacterium limosum]
TPTPDPQPSNDNPYGFTSIFSSSYYLSYGDGPDENIRQFQRDCNFCGYWGETGPLTEDALYGSESQYACECIQRFHGLVVDGEYGIKTDIALMTEIAQIQETLKRQGYDIAIDGGAGPISIAALKDFQTKNGLEADGICGDLTRAALGI